jgi:hypothetical protein
MKDLLLRRDVYACQTNDGCVLMDSATGKYFGLDRRSTLALARRIKGWPDNEDVADCGGRSIGEERDATEPAQLIDALMRSPALLTDSPDLGKAAAFPVLRQTASIPFAGNILPWPHIRAGHMRAFCHAYLQALFDIKCRSLTETVRRIQARNSGHPFPGTEPARTIELVRVFRFIRPLFYTAKDRCLFDSLALMEFLAAFDAFPTWVIAVRTRPFAAHSWVISDTLLLNERLETAEEFFPILAV